MNTQIDTRRVTLRCLTAADTPDLFRTVGDPVVMQYWIGGPDRTLKATERRIVEMEEHWRSHGFGDWGVVEKGHNRLIGFCGLHYIAAMAEVNLGYAFEQSVWRKGYAFECCQSTLDYGVQELGFDTIVAVIWPENVASIGLAEKLGLEFWKTCVWQGAERVVYRLVKDVP